MADLVASMKKAALDAVNASNPVALVFGKVKSVEPFELVIDQKLVVTEEFIVVGQYVKEYSLDLTIDGEMWHGFRVGDELLLARMQGGQRYCVIDFIRRVEEDTRPAQIMIGQVVSAEPRIRINDYLTLGPDQLILTRNVTDYYVDFSVSHRTEPETEHVHEVWDKYPKEVVYLGKAIPTDHLHGYKGRKMFLVHNGLVSGDEVLLVCQRVIQKWVVVDFITRSEKEVRGEWA